MFLNGLVTECVNLFFTFLIRLFGTKHVDFETTAAMKIGTSVNYNMGFILMLMYDLYLPK